MGTPEPKKAAVHSTWTQFYPILLFSFLCISLAPVGVVNWLNIQTMKGAFEKETIRGQAALATHVAESAQDFIGAFKAELHAAAEQDGFASAQPAAQKPHLDRMMRRHPAFLELSVFDRDGKETLRVDRFPRLRTPAREASSRPWAEAGAKGGFMGALSYARDGYPALTIAVPIASRKRGPGAKPGALVGRISLGELSLRLLRRFPAQSPEKAIVLSLTGDKAFLVSHSSAEPCAKARNIPREILQFLWSQDRQGPGGRIDFADGAGIIGSTARVKDLDWVVFVQRPVESTDPVAERMRKKSGMLILPLLALASLLAYGVADLISQRVAFKT
ncbi:MAG: cache domain-containing protein [Elusimicrobiota bacterium]